MPVVIKIGQMVGASTTLDNPQKLARAVELFCEAEGGEGASTWTNQEKVDFAAEQIARELRRRARRHLRARAERAAALDAEQSEEI